MQKNESELKQAEVQQEKDLNSQQNQSQQIKEEKPQANIQSDESSLTQNQAQNLSKQKNQAKTSLEAKYNNPDTSLENISIQSPIKKPTNKNESKINENKILSLGKISQKVGVQSKQQSQSEAISNTKLNSETYMKSSIKSSQRVKKINKPFYEETFYITGMKENYLLLLSDTNQVLQFPIGMFTTHTENGDAQNRSEDGSIANQNFHLIKDIKIGQPIKIKLEIDFLRQEKDERIFNSLQKTIHEEYSDDMEEASERKNKQIYLKRNNK